MICRRMVMTASWADNLVFYSTWNFLIRKFWFESVDCGEVSLAQHRDSWLRSRRTSGIGWAFGRSSGATIYTYLEVETVV